MRRLHLNCLRFRIWICIVYQIPLIFGTRCARWIFGSHLWGAWWLWLMRFIKRRNIIILYFLNFMSGSPGLPLTILNIKERNFRNLKEWLIRFLNMSKWLISLRYSLRDFNTYSVRAKTRKVNEWGTYYNHWYVMIILKLNEIKL